MQREELLASLKAFGGDAKLVTPQQVGLSARRRVVEVSVEVSEEGSFRGGKFPGKLPRRVVEVSVDVVSGLASIPAVREDAVALCSAEAYAVLRRAHVCMPCVWCVCLSVCARACVRVRVCVCARACVGAGVCARANVCVRACVSVAGGGHGASMPFASR